MVYSRDRAGSGHCSEARRRARGADDVDARGGRELDDGEAHRAARAAHLRRARVYRRKKTGNYTRTGDVET